MKETTIDQTLVLCDLDSLLLDAAGNLPPAPAGRAAAFCQQGRQADRFLSALAPGGPLSVGRGAGSVRLRWSAAAHWPTTFRRVSAPRCAALRGWRSLS